MLKKLTKRVIEEAKPQAKYYRIHDTLITGLALQIQPTGRKYWKLTAEGQVKTLGQFPVMTLEMAREKGKRILTGEEAQKGKVPTLDQFLASHYSAHLQTKHSTPRESENNITRFQWGKYRLDEIDKAKVTGWRNQAIKRGLAPTTCNRYIAALRSCLQEAVELEILTENPLSRLKPLRVDKTGVIRYLDQEEEQRLLAALDGATPWLKAITVVALNTGCRRGELWNLVWGDVDFKQGNLTIQGKGAKSLQTRHIPLNNAAEKALLEHRGDALPLPSVSVFGRHEFRKSWRTLMKAAEVENFRFHDCRHNFASKLVMRGVPLNTVRELLGHHSLEMTLKYAHLAPDNLRQAVEMLP